jgi:hypothetical protein
VTTGGSTNPSDYGIAKGHGKIVATVLLAAEGSAARGVHLALQIAGGIVLAAGVVAAFAARHRVERVDDAEL